MPTKKLIEVALPLDDINAASVRENYIYKGNPSAVHKWWAQRPLAVCRAVLFASLVDDPDQEGVSAELLSEIDRLPAPELPDSQEVPLGEQRRQRLFRFIKTLVQWESSNDERVLGTARRLIHAATGGNPPPIYDPFAGGGSIPLEAQRLGLEAHASDLNPVAVLINKALLEIPPKFANMPPVNPIDRNQIGAEWKGATGLAADVRYYGKRMRDEAEQRIGHLYPKIQLPKEHGGGLATVIAWLWARTVTCPNPACGATAPLVRSFAVSTRKGRETYVEPVVERREKGVHFEVCNGISKSREGTVGRKGARCAVCAAPMSLEHIRAEGKSGRMGMQLMTIVVEGKTGRIYLPPDKEHERVAIGATPAWAPETEMPEQALGFRVQNYGFTRHRDLFTGRQLVAMTTLHTLLGEVKEQILADVTRWQVQGDDRDVNAYVQALITYLEFALDKLSLYTCAFARWYPKEDRPLMLFDRQAISMIWDFPEGNPFNDIGGSFIKSIDIVADSIPFVAGSPRARAFQQDASTSTFEGEAIISTDPPYYDNVPYADLSDYFYTWQRSSLSSIYPDLFTTVLVPKANEIVADPLRHGGRAQAEAHFLRGINESFVRCRSIHSASYPMTVYYAFKQAETDVDDEILSVDAASTGWETMLEGLMDCGCTITGTWPMRTERAGRMRDMASNALASSIVLVCRPRPENARSTTRLEFIRTLRRELPGALRALQHANIAPVDLAQAAIGPGMAIYSRYKAVLEADGTPMRVRTALQLINAALDEVLAEQEGEYDNDTRWAIAWFEQSAFEEGQYGVAETLSKAKNTSVQGMVEAGVASARAGKVRLLRRDELPADWDPARDRRITAWEATQHLVRSLDKHGERGAAAVLAALPGGIADVARDLAYRLYTTCERKKWAQEALAYNSLVVAWPEIARLAAEQARGGPVQTGFDL